MSTAADSPDDEDLAARLAAANEADARLACQLLYRRYARRLIGYLRTRAPAGELDDVHAAVWLRVWQSRRTLRHGHFRGWLFSVASNLAIDWHRRRRPEAHADLPERIDEREPAPDSAVLDRERHDRLRRCLEKLEPKSRRLVQSRLDGHSYPEICKELAIERDQAYWLYHQAQRQLQDCVGRDHS